MAESHHKPRAAVAIACFNQASFLSQAIESVLAQTRLVDEIIVVDDGSTDSTAEVAQSYPQVRYHWKSNGGLSSARNAGLGLTTCEFILFLDADDTLEPEAIALSLAGLLRNPSAAFAYGGYREVDSDGRPIFERSPDPAGESYDGLLTFNRIGMHGTVLYRADVLREAGGFDSSLAACEDYDVYLRLARRHAVARYDYIAANYRRHGGNMTRNSLLMLRTSRIVLERQRPHAQGDAKLEKAIRLGKNLFYDTYGNQLARAIVEGLKSPPSFGPSVRMLMIGLCDWRFLYWMSRVVGRKVKAATVG